MIVTDAAQGIGETVAGAFAGRGARVALADLSEPAGAPVVYDLQQMGLSAHAMAVDVSRSDHVNTLAQAAIKEAIH